MRPLLAGLAAMGALVSACAEPCDCPTGQSCAEDGACAPECGRAEDCPAQSCAEDDLCCSVVPICSLGLCRPKPVRPEQCGPSPAIPEGWDDAPGSGALFAVSRLAIARDARVDVDGRCDADDCVENRWAPLGEVLDDAIRAAVLGGEVVVVIEVAGLDPDFDGFDPSVTVKLYSARDADVPFFPANNFGSPWDGGACCEFLLDPSSLQDGRARYRLPARIRDGRLFTEPGAASAIEIEWPPLRFGPYGDETWGAAPMRLVRPQLQASLSNRDRLTDGQLSGVISPAWLASAATPACREVVPGVCPVALGEAGTMLDLTAALAGQPDVDREEDGLDCYYDGDGDGLLDLCCPRQGTPGCPGGPCAAADPVSSAPLSCAANRVMRDGYSATLEFHATPAQIVGVAP